MAAKLVTGSRGTSVRSSHGKTRANVPMMDTAIVKNGSKTLTVIGRRISHEAVKDFFLEETATLVLHILIPLLASIALYFGIANFPLSEHNAPAEKSSVTYCVSAPTTSTDSLKVEGK